MLQTRKQQCMESFRADEQLEDVQYTQEGEPSNDEWSAYKLDLTDCVDSDTITMHTVLKKLRVISKLSR